LTSLTKTVMWGWDRWASQVYRQGQPYTVLKDPAV